MRRVTPWPGSLTKLVENEVNRPIWRMPNVAFLFDVIPIYNTYFGLFCIIFHIYIGRCT